ncbi:MAG: hypothetical protein HKN56_03520 [Gammaproteobacteria bacterium]|nr:hypothetical protein [Gammaproteobacteria bacterium]
MGRCHATFSAVLLFSLLTAPVGALALTPAEDADGDNMLDTWEIANGLNPADPTDADLDNDNDLVPNKGEYHLGSDPNDGSSLPPLTPNYQESFETGTIPAPWFNLTNNPLTLSAEDITAWEGNWSLRSDDVPQYGNADIVLPVFIPKSELNFRWYLNATYNDAIRLYVDDVLVYEEWALLRAWRPSPSIQLDSGYHEIRFTYYEPQRIKQGCKCLRLDDIVFTSLDTDLDGIDDDVEIANGLNPNDPADALQDADADGLTNLDEFLRGTGINEPDSDSDGLDDGDEVNIYGTDPLDSDSDDDEMNDGFEAGNGLDPLDATDADEDLDLDGVSNYAEFLLGTDPNDASSTPTFTNNYVESFEAGVLPANWIVPSSAEGGFFATNVTASDGVWSLESEQISASGEQAAIEFGLIHLDTALQFDVYLNSANNIVPEFRFYIDDVLVWNPTNMPRAWLRSPEFQIGNGLHEYRFEFDRLGTNGCRCVRIDNIRFTLLDADEDLIRDSWELDNGLDPSDPTDATQDPDGDGLSNLEEYLQGTLPFDADSDNDGVNDGDEINVYGTDALNADSDADDMTDGFEVDNGLDPLDSADRDLDADGDGVSNYGEFQLGTDPSDPASVPPYSDNYVESFEAATLPAGWSIPASADGGFALTTVTASDGSQSIESEQISEAFETAEIQLATAHSDADIAFDVYLNSINGTSNNIELHLYVDDVLAWTGSSLPYGWRRDITITVPEGYHEYRFEFDRIGTSGCRCVRIDNFRVIPIDVDDDGMRDDWELANGLDPADPTDAALDPDTDGLTNLEEFNADANPFNSDTDGDTLIDGAEVNTYGTDPANGDSDFDLMRDDFEIANGLDPLLANDATLDSDGDGFINRDEYHLETDLFDAGSAPQLSKGFIEDFEDPLSRAWYNPGGDQQEWGLTDIDNNGGTMSLKNFNDPETGTKVMEVLIYTVEGTIDFDYRLEEAAPDNGQDALRVFIDNGFRVNQNTDSEWQNYSRTLSEGLHRIRFEHFGARASNFGLIDNLRFTAADFDEDGVLDAYELANGLDITDPSDANTDLDGDGLSNIEEFWLGIPANTADTDGDGVSDGDEVLIHDSDPDDTDSDNDGLTDGYEVANGFDPNVSNINIDTDGDSVNDVAEFSLGTDPLDPVSTPPFSDDYAESFESGALPAGWTVPPGSTAGFVPTQITASDGIWSIESEPLGNNGPQVANVEFSLVQRATQLNFDIYVNSRNDVTEFRLYIDGVQVWAPRNLARGWVQSPTFDIDPGFHTYRFSFDRFGTSGCRCVRIDNIRFTLADVDEDGIRDDFELANGLNPADPADALLDADGDGLTNLEEFELGLDLNVADGDGDGLNDGGEVAAGTDANDSDSDDDLLSDGYEVSNGLDPRNPSDAYRDNDGDGVHNLGEQRLGRDPQVAEPLPPTTDNLTVGFEDGLIPADWFVPVTTDADWQTDNVTGRASAWSLASSSIDRFEDAAIVLPVTTFAADLEFFHYWNAQSGDEFRVLVNDQVVYEIESAARGWVKAPVIALPEGYNEIRFEHNEDAFNSSGCECTRIDDIVITRRDSDGDGLRDDYETAMGLDPTDPADGEADADSDGLDLAGEVTRGTDPTNPDSDGDGLSDGDEVSIWFSDPGSVDSDGDQLTDGWEVDNGLDPTRANAFTADADDDGITDLNEFILGSDPLDAASQPAAIGSLTESFESGSLPAGWYQPDNVSGTPTEWTIASDESSDGVNSLRSADTTPIGDFTQIRRINWTFSTDAAALRLESNLISNLNSSSVRLYVRLNGSVIRSRNPFTGDGWLEVYPDIPLILDPGVYTLQFEFQGRRGFNSNAWIDNIRLTELGNVMP